MSYGRKLVTVISGGVFDLLDPVLERHSLDPQTKCNSFMTGNCNGNKIQSAQYRRAICYHKNYRNSTADGLPWLEGACITRVQRGGSWSSYPGHLRAAFRIKFGPT